MLSIKERLANSARNIADLQIGGLAFPKRDSAKPTFSFGCFYSGVPKNTGEQIDRTTRMPFNRSRDLDQFIRLVGTARGTVARERQAFRDLLLGKDDPPELLSDPRQWELSGLLVELHGAVRALVADGQGIEPVARAMRRIHGALVSWGLDWYQGEVVVKTVYEAAMRCGKGHTADKQSIFDQTACKMSGGGGGGSLVWLAPQQCAEEIQSRLGRLFAEDETMAGAAELEFSECGWPEVPGLLRESLVPPGSTRAERMGEPSNDAGRRIVGCSPQLARVRKAILDHGRGSSPVLILGETGVGKDLVARALHDESGREPFVPVDCARLEGEEGLVMMFGQERGSGRPGFIGKIEEANGGTLYLAEIGSMPKEAQNKLQWFLEHHTITRHHGNVDIPLNVRIISATNRNIQRMVEAEELHKSIYFHLAGAVIKIPPLRHRREDILPLSEYLLTHAREAERRMEIKGFSDSAKAALEKWVWPGNVHEMIRVTKAAVERCQGTLITLEDLALPGEGVGILDETAGKGGTGAATEGGSGQSEMEAQDADGGDQRPFWTKDEVFKAVSEYRSKHAREYKQFRGALGDPGATERAKDRVRAKARRVFGRNAIVKALQVRTPSYVGDSPAWKAMAAELGFELQRTKLRGTARTAKGGRLGFEKAVEEWSASRSAGTDHQRPEESLAGEENEKAIPLLREIGSRGEKGEVEAEKLAGMLVRGEITFAELQRRARGFLQQEG
jgi:DNA-binding NtrC family response regulator